MAEWKKGLFACMDVEGGVKTLCCWALPWNSPCNMGKTWDHFEQPGGCFVGALLGGGAPCMFLLRGAVTKKYGITEDIGGRIVGTLFGGCGLCQIYQEMMGRGEGPWIKSSAGLS